MINEQSYQILGMKQDNLIATGNSSKFAHEIMNMRFNTIGDYTTASWTTEKGTKKVDIDESDSTWEKYKSITSVVELAELSPIGQCNINDTWVIFGKFSNAKASIQDVIIQFKLEETDNNYKLVLKLLYYGNLNFDTKHPIEALGYYESDKIQKVYWVDGINQQRVINISNVKYAYGKDTQFDFVPSVCLSEGVTVEKLSNGTGLFPPGTVKYAITYLYEYGQESNIIWTSPLYYPTIGNRACSPDELSGDSFKITVDYIDTSDTGIFGKDNEHGFDIIRLYSIIRTSDNATPIVRIVDEKRINDLPEVTNDSIHYRKQAVFIDTNTTGEIIDPSKLNFIGGKPFIAQTLSQKDNTLFLGNLTLKTSSAKAVINSDENIKNSFNESKESTDTDFKYYPTSGISLTNSIKDKTVKLYNNDGSAYQYIPQTTESSRTIKTFKYREEYRFGIQFQDSYGIWSDVLHIRDKKNDKKPEHINNGYRLARFEYTLPSDVALAFKKEGFKKARLVCCYPNNADREIIAQGVLNPTVSNTKDEITHSPDFSASWFFRPYVYRNNEYKQLKYIDGNSPEIQACRTSDYGTNEAINSYYKINSTKFTFNSPEIDFDDSIKTLPSDGFKIRIVGYIPIHSYTNSVYIDASSPLTNVAGNKGIGLVNNLTVQNISLNLKKYIDLSEAAWRDYDNYYRTGENNAGALYDYEIYPFQRKGSLNNYIKDINDWKAHHINGSTNADYETYPIKETAKLNSKVYSHLAYSLYSDYSDNVPNLTLDELNLISDSSPLPTKLGQDIYMGSLDTILPMWVDNTKSLLSGKLSNDPTGANSQITLEIFGFYYIWANNYFEYKQAGDDAPNNYNIPVATDPIPITYKTLPHAVFSISEESVGPETYSIGDSHPPYLYLAEIYRDNDNTGTKFGGDAETAFNAFVPCGDAVSLTNNPVILLGKEGDTYLQRYDCLKTVPLRTDDTNQIVEILSFACETRINLDGRYDKNRGLYDNTTVNETNFNLINKSYTQTDNLFTYFILSDLDSTLDVFPNQFTWSLPKVVSDTVDTWTNISLESTADADGIYGKINKIVNNNNRLILFQDHAISQIGFNESTAISTETGIPLELAKTGKFTGLNYLTTEIGCQNKWSISSTKNGIFFIDDSRQELLALSEGFTSLSTMHGFDAFMINQLPTTFKTWNPIEFDNFITYYDKLSNDVYYINKSVCLAWNEQTKTFTSFYNYENVPYMMNIGQHNFLLKNGVYAAREDDTYSKFFDEVKDYWITIACDGQTNRGSAFPADKVFNNVEYRADIYNLDGSNTNYSVSIFNKKQAWNGYQNSNECSLDGIRKFNTWRIQLPRHAGTRDRIRSPFCYIKLKQDQSIKQQIDRAILHDLAVYFDMK